MMRAALPMYDLEELRDAQDAAWAAIAAHVPGAPAALTRDMKLQDVWTDPGLLLAQTCGYPLVTSLRDRVVLLATPCYDAEGCDGASYRSAIVVRAGDTARALADLRGRRCAVNDAASNSGMNMLRAEVAPLAGGGRFFGDVLWTGGHVGSVEAVAGTAADVAAIDCVTWAHLRRLRPGLTDRLRVLGWTSATPGLPLITSVQTSAAMRDVLIRALMEFGRDPAQRRVREALGLVGFAQVPPGGYEVICDLERRAAAQGYKVLR